MTFDVNKAAQGHVPKPKLGGGATLKVSNWAEQKKQAEELQATLKLDFLCCEDALDFMIHGFNWGATPQGEAYWQDVYENLCK